MSEKKILVGTIDYPASKRVVQKDVDVVELSGTNAVQVKTSTGRKWRSEAGALLAFSLQAPKHIFEKPPEGTPLPGDLSGYGGFKISKENIDLWNNFAKVAGAMEAQTTIFLTPSTFTPSRANVDALSAFLKHVRSEGPVSNTDIAWEPKGPWEMEQAAAFALDNDLLLAVDPLRDTPPMGPKAYFRLGPFAAMGSRMGLYDLERIKEAALRFDEVTCVFYTNRALDDARNLKKILE